MKFHFLSDTLRKNSGFANVSKNIMLELKKRGHTCTMTGLNSAYIKTWDYGIESFPIATEHVSEEVKYLTNLMETKPDIIFNLFGSDTGDMDSLLEIPLQLGIKKRIWYVPVDGLGLGINSINSLKRFTDSGGKVIAQCNWGAKQLLENGIEVSATIYHGYNEKIFKKLDKKWDEYCWYSTDIGKNESRPELLCKYGCYKCKGNVSPDCFFPSGFYPPNEDIGIMKYDISNRRLEYSYYPINSIKDLVKGKYVFGFVGANFGIRKRIERLLKAYSLLIKDNKQLTDRTMLWLHTVPVSNVGINLLNISQKLGIEKNVIFSYGSDRGSGWSEEAMCRLYNIFDCHISPSSGEGFNLPTLESMACGTPNIGTNICSFPELIGIDKKRGVLVDCELQMLQDGIYRGLINEEELCISMKEIYTYLNKKDCSNDCIKFASQYTWSKVTDRWIKIFDGL